MQSLVKLIALVTINFLMLTPATLLAGSDSPGPDAKQSQLAQSTLLAAANHPVAKAATVQAPTHRQPEAQSHTPTSLHKHTKTHPAAIILLVMVIAGVFLMPALMERCLPGFVQRFEVRV